jgi:transglutaminase-like putative cysteine protease
MRARAVIAAFCTIAVPVVTFAQSPGTGAPSTIESDVHSFRIDNDGSVVELDTTTLRANTAAGIDDVGQRFVWFDKDSEHVDILDAYTLDADGTRHPVRADQIRDVQEPREPGAPAFLNAQLKVVIFPAVTVGSRVTLSFRKMRPKAVVPGQFSYFVEPTRAPVEDQKLIFDLPADRPLYADARGYLTQPPVTENGRTRYEFDYSRTDYPRIESGAVGYTTWGDRLMVSTFPDFPAFADAYAGPANDPSAQDPAVLALARALTAHLSDPRDKAKALYDWMRFNVRYVALFVGQTATVPHRVVDVLANRYGDCKDHVALFGALLSAVGIRNEAALLSLGSVYTLPSVPGYGAGAINHVIVWMPDLGLYADSSSGGGTAFGHLPAALIDRPVLLVQQRVMARTPPSQPLTRVARLQIDVVPNGDARYAYHVDDGGWSAEIERNVLRRATPERRALLLVERLRATGLRGTGELNSSDVAATSGPFSSTAHGTLDHLVWPTGTTALPALSSLSGGIATQVQRWLAEPVRTQPYVCLPGEFDETGQITLPDTVRVIDVPDDVELGDRWFDYRAHYVYDADTRTLQISRHLSARFDRQMCTPESFAANRAVLEKIERDAFSQVVVTRNRKRQALVRED